MAGFIPEITTRVSVTMDTSELDDAISLLQEGILGETGLADEFIAVKEKLNKVREPLASAVSHRLQSNQEMIIASKHSISNMMASSVDISEDGEDYLVGNTAMSVDGFPYPLAIEKGSRDHWIAPVTFSALHWTDDSGEHWSKGHMVSGITADPFVDPSIENTIWDIEEIWEDLDI